MSRGRQPRRRNATGNTDWTAWLVPVDQVWRLPLDALLLVTLLFAAFSYGAAEPWSQQLVALGAVAVGGYTLVACLIPRMGCRPVGSWTYVPIAAFLLLVVLQTVPLPAGLVQSLAPGTYATRTTLLSDLNVADEPMTLSLAPAATRRQLWPLLPVIAVFLAVLHAYRSESGVRRIAQLLMLAAAAVVGQAIWQNATGGHTRFTNSANGPFLNHSHFGQFVNLGIGASLGLILITLSRLGKKHRTPGQVWQKLTKEREHLPVWFAAGVVVIGAVAIGLSFTRGGVISFLIAGGVVGVLLAVVRGPRGGGGSTAGAASGTDKAAVLLALGLAVLVAALAFGFDQIYERMASLRAFDDAQAGRFQIVTDLWPALRNYPLWGSGLGTFEFVYPKYDSTDVTALTTHAENEYAHLALETGIAGLLCIAAFLGVVVAAAVRVIRRPLRSIDYLAHGLLFGLVAILVHSLSDFGQHLPAVALMTALTAAGLINVAALHSARPADDDGRRPLPSAKQPERAAAAASAGPRALRWAGPAALATLVLASGLGAAQLSAPEQARAEFAAGQAIEERIYGPDSDLIRPGDDERMIRRYAAAAALDPATPTYAYLRDTFSWGLLGYDEAGTPIDLTDDPDARAAVTELLAQTDAARRQTPTFGPLHRVAGEARLLGLGDADLGSQLIAQGADLTPHDPGAAFAAGQAAARRGDRAAADRHLARAARIRGGLRREVVDLYLHELNDPDVAYRYAADDLGALQHLRGQLKSGSDAHADHDNLLLTVDADIRALVIARATADRPSPADIAALAVIRAREGEPERAITLYQQAVALAPKRIEWRLELGRLYAAQGDPEQAVREARTVLQLRPAHPAAIALLDEQVVLLAPAGS